jgi:hypothetical protein
MIKAWSMAGTYDFENEFQFQLQGYPGVTSAVNPPPHNRE